METKASQFNEVLLFCLSREIQEENIQQDCYLGWVLQPDKVASLHTEPIFTIRAPRTTQTASALVSVAFDGFCLFREKHEILRGSMIMTVGDSKGFSVAT